VLLDAADRDRWGNLLTDRNGVRMVYENFTNGDITLKFKMDYTGGPYGIGTWTPTDPNCPWYGLPDTSQVLKDGKLYMMGVVLEQGGWWGPAIYYDPAPEDPNEHELVEYPYFVVPAGLTWETFDFLIGSRFFNSPAHAVVNVDGVLSDYYDSNPYPQSIPEPASLALIGLGGLFAFARKTGRRVNHSAR
jgi:hypothetical protein